MREGGRERRRERREPASPQRLQLEGWSPGKAQGAGGGGDEPTPRAAPEEEPRGQGRGRLGGGVTAASSVKLGLLRRDG